jgi:DNA-directed RNA polymerase specialized sigma24 family protein
MTRDDLYQEIWTGVMTAIRTGNPERGPLSLWAIRQGLQRAYDSIRWADRHSDELFAIPTDSEIAEQIAAFATDEERLNTPLIARIAALTSRASGFAKRVFVEILDATRHGEPYEPRLTAAGIDEKQLDRALNELRPLIGAAMSGTIAANSFVANVRRGRRESQQSRKP